MSREQAGKNAFLQQAAYERKFNFSGRRSGSASAGKCLPALPRRRVCGVMSGKLPAGGFRKLPIGKLKQDLKVWRMSRKPEEAVSLLVHGLKIAQKSVNNYYFQIVTSTIQKRTGYIPALHEEKFSKKIFGESLPRDGRNIAGLGA